MNRDKLIEQVKKEYSRLAVDEDQQHFVQTTNAITADAYYGNLLNMVEKEISAGTFDSFRSGLEIVEAVANDKHKWLKDWKKEKNIEQNDPNNEYKVIKAIISITFTS